MHILRVAALFAALATAFPTNLAFVQRPLSRSRHGIIAATTSTSSTSNNVAEIDDVSTPESLIEEEMLRGPQQTFLSEIPKPDREKAWKRLNKVAKAENRAARSGGSGFGAAAGKDSTIEQEGGEHEAFSPKVDESRYGAVIMEQGVARINERFSKETAAAVLEFVNQSLKEALNPPDMDSMDLADIYKQQTRFADVQGKLNRWDMLLPLEESNAIMQALYELLLKDHILSETIKSILGPAAQLYELGTLISDPGSERQTLHADYNYQPDFQPKVPPALTCFVALQDIDANMGPTTFLPSSATERHHEEIVDRQWDFPSKEGLLAESHNVLSTLNSGDCSIYNPMTLHCGGANRSEKRRCIFYFSFKNPKFDEKDMPLAYASLSPDLRARALSLPDMHGILNDWNESRKKLVI